VAPLQIRLLGQFEVRSDAGPIDLGGPKQQALFAYLACRAGQPVARRELSTLLWGDRFDVQARQSLRQALSRVRRALKVAGADRLHADRDSVAFPAGGAEVDVARFRALAAQTDVSAMQQAASLFGIFLDGMSVGQADFEDWLGAERHRFNEEAGDLFERLSAALQASGDPDRGVAVAERWVALDPLSDDAHRRLLALLAQSGDRAGALRRYRDFERLLREELGIEPEPETRDLAKSIREGSGVWAGGTAKVPDREQSLDMPGIALAIETDAVGGGELDGRIGDFEYELNHRLVQGRRHRLVADAGRADFVAQLRLTCRDNGLRLDLQLRNRDGAVVCSERFAQVADDVGQALAALADQAAFAIQIGGYGAGAGNEGDRMSVLFRAGMTHFNTARTDGLHEALRCFEGAMAMQPANADVMSMLAFCHYTLAIFVWDEDAAHHWRMFVELGERAVGLDASLPFPLTVGTLAALKQGQKDRAVDFIERAVELHGNWPIVWRTRAQVHEAHGEFEAAIGDAQRAMGLGPRSPWAFVDEWLIAFYLFKLGRYEQALAMARQCRATRPDFGLIDYLIALASNALGDEEGARQAVARLNRVSPKVPAEAFRSAPGRAHRNSEDEDIATLARLGWAGT
jgi:DNA-binding SARP family transcriptional activator